MEYPSHTIQAYLRRQSNQALEMTLEVFLPEEETDHTRFIIREIQTIFLERFDSANKEFSD